MSRYSIIPVENRRQLMQFIKFPDELYRNCPQYVPALHSDQVKSLTTCSTARYCPHVMWLAVGNGKVVGRICAMVNPRYNEHYGTKRGRFGWFDCIEDYEVAELLLSTAEKWLKEQGMEEIHGPLFYNTLGKQGMLIEGFENIPPFNCLYNFPYYRDYVERYGFEKECDWLQYKVLIDNGIPDRIQAIAARLRERYDLVEGDIDKLKKDKAFVRKFFQIYSDSFAANVYNFVPFTEEEMKEEADSVMGLLNKDLCTALMTREGEIVAFGITFPTISLALQKAKGRLFPFGWYHLLKALHNYETVDLMINGAAPEWQHKGISAVYHCIMYENTQKVHAHWGITNPQIESNEAVKVWESYNPEPFMRRRAFIKKIK